MKETLASLTWREPARPEACKAPSIMCQRPWMRPMTVNHRGREAVVDLGHVDVLPPEARPLPGSFAELRGEKPGSATRGTRSRYTSFTWGGGALPPFV